MGKPSKKILIVWRLRLAAVMVLLLFGISFFFLGNRLWVLLVGGLVGVGLLLGCIYYPIKYHRLTYTLERGWFRIGCGVLYSRVKAIPVENIQYTSLSALPLAQKMGLCTLIIHGAGGSILLPGLPVGEATRLQGILLRRGEGA